MTDLMILVGVILVLAAAPMMAGSPNVVPEPGYFAVVGGGIGAMILLARWKRSRK